MVGLPVCSDRSAHDDEARPSVIDHVCDQQRCCSLVDEFTEQSGRVSTLFVVAMNSANAEPDFVIGSTVAQVKQTPRPGAYGQKWRERMAVLQATTMLSHGVLLEGVDSSHFLIEREPVPSWMLRTGPAGRWVIDNAPSFSLAAIRIGVVQVEQRALGNPCSVSVPGDEAYFWMLKGHSPRVQEAVTTTIATNHRTEPQLPEQGRNWVGEHYLKQNCTKSMFHELGHAVIHTRAESGEYEAAVALAGALISAVRDSWLVMHSALTLVGLRYLCSSTQRDRQLNATQQARTRLRLSMLRRCAGTCRPGQTVTATPHVCRGPNSAGQQPTRANLRSAPIY
ncbi:hypothetical protein [Nocardia salmonicida]|uniref:hypothetical protein n=1 Tax=Nocardia salmonicida TaxID=53431 RepID=UPI00341097A6